MPRPRKTTNEWLENLRDSWRNGNRKDVIAQLDKLHKQEAMYATAALLVLLQNPNDHYEENVFMRLLGDRLPEPSYK